MHSSPRMISIQDRHLRVSTALLITLISIWPVILLPALVLPYDLTTTLAAKFCAILFISATVLCLSIVTYLLRNECLSIALLPKNKLAVLIVCTLGAAAVLLDRQIFSALIEGYDQIAYFSQPGFYV